MASSGFPLTETMRGMFLEWNEARESKQYTIAVVNAWPKTIDADRLVRAVEESVAAHEIFRMRFVETEGEVRWTIDDSIAIKVKREEMSDAEAGDLARKFVRGFDAFKGPLARFRLVESPTGYRLFTEIFHVISDGTTFRRFFHEVEERYDRQGMSVPEVRPHEDTPFSEYAEAEERSFEGEAYRAAREDAISRFSGRAMTVPEENGKGKRENGNIR